MDYSNLIEEIARRVAAKLETAAPAEPESASDAAPAAPAGCEGKPRLLILTQEHGAMCHDVLSSTNLLEYYHTECALMQNYEVDLNAFEAVILFNLDCDALARLSGGVCDTPYTKLAQKAILLGKKLFVPEEEVELLQYRQTAPAAYYQARLAQLTLLQQSGVTVCPVSQLEQIILSGETLAAPAASTAAPVAASPAVSAPATQSACTAPSSKEITLTKRIITERDLRLAKEEGISTVHISAKSIVTDLARDYAQERQMLLLKD